MDRRSFLKTVGAVGVASGTALAGSESRAAGSPAATQEFSGVLVDTTRCVGCRTCEESCAEANKLPDPNTGDDSVLEGFRETSPSNWSVINRFKTSKGEVFAKKQCMHCNQPACATACLVKAMLKTPEGPVIWRGDKCMGCRFCMVSCPFDVPKFEFDSANPRILKCVMCHKRLAKGEPPACAENCPEEAVVAGKRRALLREARQRILKHPKRYVDHIYGEHEAGGTGYLYLSGVPFEQLRMRGDLGTVAYPALTKEFLYSVPVVFTVLPALLLGLSKAAERREKGPDKGSEV